MDSGRHVINTGSAGYVVLSAQGRDLSAEFIRTAYNVEAAARAIEATEMPHEYAEMLRLGAG